ncbi:lipase [Microbacterium sp. Sa4CUA7]|uniref:Lipase n=1 Tax=Microbacterium pullorum TaxID=2762236 RepID=A0ABR8RZ28_9MICO|nr:GDSL-type esterase/lipase family protein [Microbacterium pullorum]MBD7956477.1 lipase [Microbacterium pullorum]
MITTPITPDLVDGVAQLENVERGMRPHRLHPHVRQRDADPQLRMMEAQPSGARLVVVTEARRIQLDVHATRVSYRMIPRPRGAIDVVIDGIPLLTHPLVEGDAGEIDLATGARSDTRGGVDSIMLDALPPGRKTVEFWLPHNEAVDLVALRSDAPVEPAPPTGPLWVHHGSSISQGSNATHPTGIWPAIAARRAGARLHNLGFGGSAVIDPFLARAIRDAPADLISVKLGINVVNLDAMRLRALVPAVHGFLDTIRDGHPSTPLLLISPLYCGIHEETPGPGSIDAASIGTDTVRFTATGPHGDTTQGRLTLQVIRDTLAEVFAARQADTRLHYLDGLTLYGEADAEEHPLPDALHPDSETHRLIGNRFADLAFAPSGAFGGA